ncbi:formate dehydrogenase, putative [Babesia ovata]|uniref:Formate dehydrogenase, putative n=1 Tax=Babesia ovata TaxID=189622 RepID=A0A2H6KHU6_9APIC|nr:formate dehydrogenase, putative [Babesia ovata]GBE62551.1 formate dehydrogenase, putative [Babesia ovata]
MFGDEPALGFCGVSLMEATSDEPRRAHLICDNLITKQRCLQMRVMPIVVAEDEERGPHPCAVVAIRPYCFWVRRTRDSPVLPFMFPKYSSREVVGEEFEAKMLLMPNNQRLLVVATMLGTGILTTDRRHLDVSSVLQLWLTELSGSKAQLLTDQLSHLHRTISNFSPHRLCVSDDLIYAADYRQLFTWTWPWDPSLAEPGDFERSRHVFHEPGNDGGSCGKICRVKRGSRHTGCIRYEHNRKRWVVDLSVNGCRMQKCFHENLYGVVGGLQAARKWRLDYIRNTYDVFDIEVERRIVNDLVDKIVALEGNEHVELLEALRKPIPSYEHILDAHSLGNIIDGRLAATGHYKP